MSLLKPLKLAACFLILAFTVPPGLLVLQATRRGNQPFIDEVVNQLPTSLVSGSPASDAIVPHAMDSVIRSSTTLGSTVQRSTLRASNSSTKHSLPVVVGNWPPIKGQEYPDLILKDQNGETVRLSDFKGRPILLELAAIPCGGCQGFAGANDFGSYAGVTAQSNLDSIHKCAKRFSKVRLGKDKNIVFVQVLLYGKSMSSPTSDEVAGWAKHFRMQRSDSNVVLQGDPSLLSRAIYQSIPGFHLINSDFALTHDSSGHHPEDDLYRDLLPALGEMARENQTDSKSTTTGQVQLDSATL